MSKTDIIGTCDVCGKPVPRDCAFQDFLHDTVRHLRCLPIPHPDFDNPGNPFGLGLGLKIVGVLARMIQTSGRLQVWEDWAKESTNPLDDFLINVLVVAIDQAAKL